VAPQVFFLNLTSSQIESILASKGTRKEFLPDISRLLSRDVSPWTLRSPNCPSYLRHSMGQLVIINAPSSFSVIWNVIKPWLSKETVEKVSILGNDYQPVLLDLVDPDSLPESLGGKCTCEGLGGCDMSSAGPWLLGRKGWGPKSQVSRVKRATAVAVDNSPGVLVSL